MQARMKECRIRKVSIIFGISLVRKIESNGNFLTQKAVSKIMYSQERFNNRQHIEEETTRKEVVQTNTERMQRRRQEAQRSKRGAQRQPVVALGNWHGQEKEKRRP